MKGRLKVAVVTGSRAEFGLLRPVMDAVRTDKRLSLQVIVAGAHFLPPARTVREVEAAFTVAARVPMQRPGRTGRIEDASALGRGVSGFAKALADLKPDWVVVLGDRIEALAAASAASVAGIAVAHIHGGDRAEGIADEAMRHAITKLSHLHLAATEASARRIIRMGEKPEHVRVTGSPAIDGLDKIKPMSDREAAEFGDPRVVVLVHPAGLKPEWERCAAHHAYIIARCPKALAASTLWLRPNGDAGWRSIEEARRNCAVRDVGVRVADHLERGRFVALLKRLAGLPGGAIVGNSSAGLIECAAIGLPAVIIGPRQNGREAGPNVLSVLNDPDVYGREDIGDRFDRAMRAARRHAGSATARQPSTQFGDGRAAARTVRLLVATDPHEPTLLRKRNTY